jgi:hypothetical protein
MIQFKKQKINFQINLAMITPFEMKNKSFESEEGFLFRSQHTRQVCFAYIIFFYIQERDLQSSEINTCESRLCAHTKKFREERLALAGISEDKRRGEESLKAISRRSFSENIKFPYSAQGIYCI